MDLHVSRVGEIRALAVAGDGSGAVAAHGVGRKEVCVAVSAGGHYHCVCGETLELARHKVLGDDTACALHTVLVLDEDHVMHLIAVVALHLAELDLAVERRIGAEQQLLAGLTLGIESSAHLGAAE